MRRYRLPTFLRERPGMSAFVLEDGVVYHTYSTYARGVDGLWGMYQWLDRAPKGRNEKGVWWRRHDEYAQMRSDIAPSFQFKSGNSPGYMHVPNCAWTATLASWEGADGETQA